MRLENNDTSILGPPRPFSLEARRPVIIRFNLDDDTSIGDWLRALNFLNGSIVESPRDLVSFRLSIFATSLSMFLDRAILSLCGRPVVCSSILTRSTLRAWPPLCSLAFWHHRFAVGGLADSTSPRRRARNTTALGMGEGFAEQ